MKSRKAAQWHRLDNAAKVFPASSSKDDPKVFRFACQLKEEVDPALLQRAMEQTLESFPLYRSVLRRGLFWYYLEASRIQPAVHQECRRPCSPLYDPVRKDLLFSVTYYRRRINLEVYHALTDGTGALQFLRMMVYHYLILRHAEAFPDGPPPMDYDASLSETADDSFRKYYTPAKKIRAEKRPPACHLSGPRLAEHGLRVIEGVLPADQVVAAAHAYHTTVTTLAASALLCAIHDEVSVREAKKPLAVAIPVNLRNFFASGSARNFFGLLNVRHTFTGKEPFEEVVKAVAEDFQSQLTEERIARRMNELCALEHNLGIQIIPLFLKDPVLRIFYRRSERGETTSLSNLGRISMPEALRPYIDLFDVFISAARLQICMCSFGNKLVLSLTSPFVSTNVQKRFFRAFSAMGIPVEIYANPDGDELD